MTFEADDVRRVDIGDGIYVVVPTTEPAEPAAAAAAAPAWAVKPYSLVLGAGPGAAGAGASGRHAARRLAAGVLAVLAVLSAIDIGWRVLPNRIVLPATAAVLAYQIAFFPDRSAERLLAALGAAAPDAAALARPARSDRHG